MEPARAKSTPVFDPIASLVYSCGQESIRSTIVAGKVVLDKGLIPGIEPEMDLETLYRQCHTAAWELARRVGTAKLVPGQH